MASAQIDSSLNATEMNQIQKKLGNKASPLIAAAARLFLAHPNSGQWHDTKQWGALVLVMDRSRNARILRLFDIVNFKVVFDEEMYVGMQYIAVKPYFHTFEVEGAIVGFDFCNETDAMAFHSSVLSMIPRADQINDGLRHINYSTDKHRTGKSIFGKLKNMMGGKTSTISSSEMVISAPTNVEHKQHIGFDRNHGFQIQNIPDEWKSLFKGAGMKPSHLKDRETAKAVFETIQRNVTHSSSDKEMLSLQPMLLSPSDSFIDTYSLNQNSSCDEYSARSSSRTSPSEHTKGMNGVERIHRNVREPISNERQTTSSIYGTKPIRQHTQQSSSATTIVPIPKSNQPSSSCEVRKLPLALGARGPPPPPPPPPPPSKHWKQKALSSIDCRRGVSSSPDVYTAPHRVQRNAPTTSRDESTHSKASLYSHYNSTHVNTVKHTPLPKSSPINSVGISSPPPPPSRVNTRAPPPPPPPPPLLLLPELPQASVMAPVAPPLRAVPTKNAFAHSNVSNARANLLQQIRMGADLRLTSKKNDDEDDNDDVTSLPDLKDMDNSKRNSLMFQIKNIMDARRDMIDVDDGDDNDDEWCC